MSRITGVERGQGSPLVRASLAAARRSVERLAGRRTERMIEPLEVFARTPGIFYGYSALEMAFSRSARVPARLKDLAVLKAATVVGCEYCIDIGSAVSRRSGLSDEELLALARHGESDLFDATEKLVLDFATAMTRTPLQVSDELFAALRERFDDAQIVELATAAALENFRSRFNTALGIGSSGLSDGMVCAVPERTFAGAPAAAPGGAHAQGNGAAPAATLHP